MAFKFTEEQLNTLDKSFIVNSFLQLQDKNDKLSGEIQELNINNFNETTRVTNSFLEKEKDNS